MSKPEKRPAAVKVTREGLAAHAILEARKAAATGDPIVRVTQLSELCFTAEEIAISLDLSPEQEAELSERSTHLGRAFVRGQLQAQEKVRRAVLAHAQTGEAKAIEKWEQLRRKQDRDARRGSLIDPDLPLLPAADRRPS